MSRPFGSTDDELKKFFSGPGKVQFRETSLVFDRYPFEPASVYNQQELPSSSISGVSVSGRPSIYLSNEIIMISAAYRQELTFFAKQNEIPIRQHSWVWSWILEPFLDTELRPEDTANLFRLLGNYGLSETAVTALRNEVEEQMMKYNFDTMLWEWVDLDLYDVLCAMRAKYDQQTFRVFYWKAMELALLPELPKSEAQDSSDSSIS